MFESAAKQTNATSPGTSLKKAPDEANTARIQRWWALWDFSPRAQLILCLALAIIVRVILIVQAHGMMEGDEAILGIQAERLLQGVFPIYIPQQLFLGTGMLISHPS